MKIQDEIDILNDKASSGKLSRKDRERLFSLAEQFDELKRDEQDMVEEDGDAI